MFILDVVNECSGGLANIIVIIKRFNLLVDSTLSIIILK